ncbi:MAG: DUF5602 domain-containing protein [Bacteroidota bacterium]
MKHTAMKMMTVALLVATFLSCKKDKDTPAPSGRFYGPAQTLGAGKVKAYVTINPAGEPTEIGAVISDEAMNSLPAGHSMLNYVLELPAIGLAKTPFKFVGLDYNPHGHEPDGIYNIPHFDFHFYKTTNAERLNITPGDPKLNIFPDPAYIPAAHFPGGGVPQMGNHWIDPTSPELNGQPFTTTFIYGSYNGKVTFMEPMITVDFIKSHDHFHAPIKQPTKFSPAGYYPTAYSVHHNEDEKQYEISMESFVARTAN